jgi:hypothetical protein
MAVRAEHGVVERHAAGVERGVISQHDGHSRLVPLQLLERPDLDDRPGAAETAGGGFVARGAGE